MTGSKLFVFQPLIEVFRKTGTSHLFALSGQHLSILILIVTIFTTNSFILIIFSFFYLAFTGWQISFLRAFFSLLLAVIIKRYRIKPKFENLISILTLLVFIFEPQNLLSISFFLSLSAIIALYSMVYFSQLLKSITIKATILPFLASLDIFIFQFPLIASYFGFINLLSPIINLIAIPLFSFSVYFSIFSLIFNPFLIFSNIGGGLFNLLSIFLILIKRIKFFILEINLEKSICFTLLFIIFLIHYLLIKIIIKDEIEKREA